VQIDMTGYTKEIVDDFHVHDPTDKIATSPAAEHIFKVREEAPKLSEEMAKIFHNFIARLLFVCKRGRPDIMEPVSFGTKRVRSPDEDDWRKLVRVVRYLRGTLDMVLTLGGAEGEEDKIVRWWVDGAHGVHQNMRGHTGGTASLGKGCLMSTSRTQGINTRSSTETELVALDDMMPQVLWTNYFLDAQGYGAQKTIVLQDNKSTILLATNGRASSSKRTKHIHMRFYFVKDRINSGEIEVEFCPSEEMVADFFTKPLQGALFIRLRNFIMNIKTAVAK
jgi:hypothetical protein